MPPAAQSIQYQLEEATQKGDEAAVRLLLEAGADPNALDSSGFTPLFLAMEREHALVIALLNQAGGKL